MKKCPKCGSRIREGSTFCVNCGAKLSGGKFLKKKKRNPYKKLLGMVAIVVLLLLGTIIVHFMLQNKDENVTVSNAEEVISLLEETGQKYGYVNALAELTEVYSENIEGEEYYRLQQNYCGIPVYGRSVVYVTNKNGERISLSGNIADISEDISLTPTVTQSLVNESVHDYLQKSIGLESDSKIVVQPIDNALCIYDLSDSIGAKLAYNTLIFVEEEENVGCYEAVVDAHTGEILDFMTTVYTDMTTFSLPGKAANIKIDVNKENDENGESYYSMVDTNRHIRIYNANNGTLKYELYDYDGRLVIDQNNNLVYEKASIDRVYPVWISSRGITQPSSYKNPPEFDKEAVSLLGNIQATYDFYEEVIGIEGVGVGNTPTWIDGVYNDFNSLDLENAYCWGLSQTHMQDMLLSFGSWNSLQTDVVAHEYTHAVEGRRSSMNYRGESGAIMEALSDIFGELAEAWISGREPDWIHNGSRNMSSPALSNDPYEYHGDKWVNTDDPKKSNDWGGVHTNNTVLSHAAYLMWNGIDGSENRKINEKQLAQIWYRAMLMMPSNCKFVECRQFCEWAALSLEELSEEQRKCVSEAFDAVGISTREETVEQVDYEIQNQTILYVYDKDGEIYGGGCELKISGSIDADSPQNLEEVYFGISYEKTEHIYPGINLGLELENGTYTCVLSSNEEPDKKYTFSLSVDSEHEYEDIKIQTNFEPLLIVNITKESEPTEPVETDEDNGTNSIKKLQQVNVTYSDGSKGQTVFRYNSSGLLTSSVFTSAYSDGSQETVYSYDSDHRLTSVQINSNAWYAIGPKAEYIYDNNGFLIESSEAEGSRVIWLYENDVNGRCIRSSAEAEGASYQSVYSYNDNSTQKDEIRTQTDYAGNITTDYISYYYDEIGQIIREEYNGAHFSHTIDYSYDSKPFVLASKSGTNVYSIYLPDIMGNPVWEIEYVEVEKIEQDNDGYLSKLIANSGAVYEFVYDKSNETDADLLTSESQHELNTFLSYFSQQWFNEVDAKTYEVKTTSFDAQKADPAQLIYFADLYTKINNGQVWYDSLDQDSKVHLSLDYVNSKLQQFFGISIDAQDVQNSGYELRDGNIYFDFAMGETYNYMTVARSWDEVSNGTFCVEFDIYRGEGKYMYAGGPIIVEDVYSFSTEEAQQDTDLIFYKSGIATVRQTGNGNNATYQLLQYELEGQTQNTEKLSFSDIPAEYTFTSGAGGWGTGLKIGTDGYFEGQYHDSNMGETGDGYPKGTVYYCNFSGKFSEPEPVNEYTYKVSLEQFSVADQTGVEYIENEIKYIASDPYGFDGPNEYYIYLPGIPSSMMPQAAFDWMSRLYGNNFGSYEVYVICSANGALPFVGEFR